MLINYTEVMVEELFDRIIEEHARQFPGTCLCEKCRESMKAMALNNLPVNYVSSRTGSIMKRVGFEENTNKGQLTAALMNAIQTVAASPNH